MQIYFSLLVCIVGALVYAISTNPKASALGLHAYWCGLLVFLLNGVGHIGLVAR